MSPPSAVVEGGEDAACLVCGEPVGLAPTRCPLCNTPHHFDCWEWSGGCGVYGCRAKVVKRSASDVEAAVKALPGKLGMPHKRTGSYAGHLWAPPLATMWLFCAQFVGMFAFALEQYDVLGPCLGIYVACWFWILCSSERMYVDFDEQRISKAKALLGRDVWEWPLAPLEEFERLEIQPVGLPGSPSRYEVLAVYRQSSKPPLELAPPIEGEGPALDEAVDLFRRIQVSGAFPARVPMLEAGEDSPVE